MERAGAPPPPTILMHESYREDGQTRKRTLANLSDWPSGQIEQLRAVLRGERLLPASEPVEILRTLPHDRVLAALSTARWIDFDSPLPRWAPQRRRDLAVALIIARPGSTGSPPCAPRGSRRRQPAVNISRGRASPVPHVSTSGVRSTRGGCIHCHFARVNMLLVARNCISFPGTNRHWACGLTAVPNAV